MVTNEPIPTWRSNRLLGENGLMGIEVPAEYGGAGMDPIAYVLAAICVVLTVVGFGWFQHAAGGYGGTKEKVIGISILLISVALFLYRRIVQDGEKPHWREDTPEVPEQAPATAT